MPAAARLGPHVVGVRVVVRHRLPDGRATDTLGICTEWGESSLVVDSDAGPVEIALADVVTGGPPEVGSSTQRPSPHAVQTPRTSVIAGPPDGPVSPGSTRRTTTRFPTTCGPKPWA